MAKTILNFHFDYWNPSLSQVKVLWSNHSYSTCLKVQIFFSQSDKKSNISLRLETIFRYGSMSKASRVMAMRLNRVSAEIKMIY